MGERCNINFFAKTLILTLVSVFLVGGLLSNAFAQNADTLLKKARYAKTPTAGIALAKKTAQLAALKNDNVIFVKALNLEAEYFWETEANDSAEFYGKYALQLAAKYHVDSLAADSWTILGLADYKNAAYKDAIYKYKQSVDLYKKRGKLMNVAITWSNIGICERKLAWYDAAVTHFLLSIKTFEALKDSSYMATSYNSIALCFASLKNYPKAIEYNKIALALRQELRENTSVAQSLNNIGFAFKEYNQPDSAIGYLNKSIALYQKQSDSSLLVLPLQNLGSAWRMKKDQELAKKHIERSLIIAANYGMKDELARGSLDLAELYLATKLYDEALRAVNLTEKTAVEINTPELLAAAYQLKYKLYSAKGSYREALFYSEKANNIKDSLFSVAKDSAIAALEIKFETNQKERDIATLNVANHLQRKFIIMLIGGAVLLFFLLLLVYKNYRVKNKSNQRIQILMRELNHRVKNNLQILSGLFTLQIQYLNDEETKNALRENQARLTSMNLVHNKLYLNDNETKIEMKEYLQKLLNHIKASFGNNNNKHIRLNIDVDIFKLDADKAVAIGLIVNELATNSFKYAFNNTDGEIYLSLKHHGKSILTLVVGDNGIGLNKVTPGHTQSFGLKLVHLMARQLNAELIIRNDHGTYYQMDISL